MPKRTSSGFWHFSIGAGLIGAVASQSVLDFAVILMFAGLIFDLVKDRAHVLSRLKLFGVEWAFAAYFIVVALGYSINASPDAEVAWQLKKFTWVLNLYLFAYGFSKTKLNKNSLIRYFSFGFLLMNIYAVATYFFRYDFVTGKDIIRVIGLVNSATYHAHANAVVFVIFAAVLYFYWEKLSRGLKSFGAVALLLFFFSIFFTMTRGIWLSIFFSSVLISGLLNYRKALGFLLASTLVCGLAATVWPEFRDRLNPAANPVSTSERLNLAKLNYQMWREYPLLGIGYGENMRRNREYWDRPEWHMPQDYITSHAHNQYLNVLSTTGAFGFLFFMSFVVFFLRKNWLFLKEAEKRAKDLTYVLLFACLWAQIEFWLACLTDVSFEYAKIRALLLFVWALIFALHRHAEMITEENSR